MKNLFIKFVFSKKPTKLDEIFTVELTLCSKCQIDGEDFVKFCGLLRKHELYKKWWDSFLLISLGLNSLPGSCASSSGHMWRWRREFSISICDFYWKHKHLFPIWSLLKTEADIEERSSPFLRLFVCSNVL